MKRTLSLRRETLAQLSADDLANVAGGIPATQSGCPVNSDVECPTHPLLECVVAKILSDSYC